MYGTTVNLVTRKPYRGINQLNYFSIHFFFLSNTIQIQLFLIKFGKKYLIFDLSLINKDIIANIKNGDDAAFKKVYDVYGRKIYNVARKFNLNHEDAEEIIQETFLKIWNNKEKIKLSLSFNAYIYTIAKSILLNHIRKNATILTYKHYIKPVEAANSTEEEVLFAELERNFNQFLNALPPQRKMIFIMSKFQDLSNDDIASKLNLSKRTVENQLYRALNSLRADMKELGISLPILITLLYC